MNDRDAILILENLKQRYEKQWTKNEQEAVCLALYYIGEKVKESQRRRTGPGQVGRAP
jgi:hypothetical protein